MPVYSRVALALSPKLWKFLYIDVKIVLFSTTMMASLDKWRTLRATHINANLGCLDYHVQWDHSSYFILVQIFTLTTYQARFTIFRLNSTIMG